MKVEEVMTPKPVHCSQQATLSEVATLMWEADCGLVPVVDRAGHVLDVITDRDLCFAVARRSQAPDSVRAHDLVRGRPVITCHAEDDLLTALGLMSAHRVRRLPVTALDDTLCGVLSLDDIVGVAGRRRSGVAPEQLLDALRTICGRSHGSSLIPGEHGDDLASTG